MCKNSAIHIGHTVTWTCWCTAIRLPVWLLAYKKKHNELFQYILLELKKVTFLISKQISSSFMCAYFQNWPCVRCTAGVIYPTSLIHKLAINKMPNLSQHFWLKISMESLELSMTYISKYQCKRTGSILPQLE